MNEEFVENFTSDGELTPIDIVAEITGLTYDEIRSCSKIVRVPGNCQRMERYDRRTDCRGRRSKSITTNLTKTKFDYEKNTYKQ